MVHTDPLHIYNALWQSYLNYFTFIYLHNRHFTRVSHYLHILYVPEIFGRIKHFMWLFSLCILYMGIAQFWQLHLQMCNQKHFKKANQTGDERQDVKVWAEPSETTQTRSGCHNTHSIHVACSAQKYFEITRGRAESLLSRWQETDQIRARQWGYLC